MDDDNYDEFGNYIGPQLLSDSSQEIQEDREQQLPSNVQIIKVSNEHKIVLHEDKKYFATHEEMYPGAEIMIEQEDRQPLQTPLINKTEEKWFDYCQLLQCKYSPAYLVDLMKNSALVRNICVAGHLHHGKTLFMDMLVQETHNRIPQWNNQKNYRWMDTRVDEQEKQLSIKAMPITLLLSNRKNKHYVLNIMDTPGHPNFFGEVAAGLRICDGVLLVVDCVQGVMLGTEKIIRNIVRDQLPVIVVLNKIDRLILQLKIPPEDAYLKLKHTLEEINGLFATVSSEIGMQNKYIISPISNNVLFSSAEYSFVFSLQSMADKYSQIFPLVESKLFSQILWGDYYFHSDTKKFTRQSQSNKKRTFVQFIMEPIYKIFSHTVGKDRDQLQSFLFNNLAVKLTAAEYKLNIKTMIKTIIKKYFKSKSCIVEQIVEHFQNPQERTAKIISKIYRGQSNDFKKKISQGKSQGPLICNTVKMYHEMDYKTFNVLGRVLSGTLKVGASVKILDQNYHPDEEENCFIQTISKLFILCGRFKIQVDEIPAGNWALISGIDQSITKTATIVSAQQSADIIVPLKYNTQAVIKIAIQPLIPNQLPKMLEAIRRVNKSYLMLKTKVQESGEHVLYGNGQMHLDCILYDIRNLYSDIQVRISDPSVSLTETVIQTSGIPCFADTPNKKNRFKTLASPLQKGISDVVEKELVNIEDRNQLKSFLQQKFEWDVLASSNVWSFGPQQYGSNIFVNDTIVSGVDQKQLQKAKQSLFQGFKWSTREGPLCDQPMRNVKFRLIDAQLSQNPADYPPGQLIPTARRAFYSAFLTANPRLMEPMYHTQIQCTSVESIDAVFAVLSKRRGAIQNDVPKPGTPHYIIKAVLPCIEALGFETDLRVHTIGQAFCVSTFDHWQIVPGDPLDKKIILRPLQVLEPQQLARQFMIKTRRRKGLNEEVSIVKYFDDFNIKELIKNDASFKDFI